MIIFDTDFVELDVLTGNFDVLLSNIGILTASSFTMSFGHFCSKNINYTVTILLGAMFIVNQSDETFSAYAASAIEESSSIIFCLSTHISHLSLSLFLFLILQNNFATELTVETLFIFVSAYWHLVEVV